MMWILSLVPWWLYAAAGVGVNLAIVRFLSPVLGDKPAAFVATTYAVAAAAWVAMDYGGDTRETWVREQWRAQAQRAQQIAKQVDAEAAADDGADLQKKLDAERLAKKEMEDALAGIGTRPGCSVDDTLERLRPR